MAFTAIFSEAFRSDLQEIFDWYEGQQKGLGDKFIEAIELSVDKMLVTPTAAAIRYDNIRCKIIKRFPFLLHYTVDVEKQIVLIYRLFHTSRKPLWEK